MGSTHRYRIGREAQWPPIRTNKNMYANLLLTWCYIEISPAQNYDHDMADSSSPINNNCSNLQIQLYLQQKKKKSALQSDHTSYTSQDIWLGFQTMELTAIDNEVPVQEVRLSIRELIKKGYRENEAAEIHTAKVSFPRIPQIKWPSTRQDGQSGHHYHLT